MTDQRDRVARAIFATKHPSNMCAADWDSGAMLGSDNSYRDDIYRMADAAIAAMDEPAPVSVGEMSVATDDKKWQSVAPWEKYKTDLVLEVHHVLTEPACPSAIVRFEMPDRAGKDVVSRADCDTIEDAIHTALEEALRALAAAHHHQHNEENTT